MVPSEWSCCVFVVTSMALTVSAAMFVSVVIWSEFSSSSFVQYFFSLSLLHGLHSVRLMCRVQRLIHFCCERGLCVLLHVRGIYRLLSPSSSQLVECPVQYNWFVLGRGHNHIAQPDSTQLNSTQTGVGRSGHSKNATQLDKKVATLLSVVKFWAELVQYFTTDKNWRFLSSWVKLSF